MRDGESGFHARERDVAGLVHGVFALLESPIRWAPVTAAARVRVEQEFDIDRLNDRLGRLYQEAAAGQPARLAESSR
ncbi:MAG: hypothetical protein ACREMH_01000 [Gemmatimonadales bacterium]